MSPIVALIALSVLLPGAAQGGPCSTPEAHAFDFWIGDWDVAQRFPQPDGRTIELQARTSVTAALDGCALVERWRGEVLFFWEGMAKPEPMSGFSVRAWDPQSRAWHIHWMDSRTPRFGDPYVGTFADGRGEFFREWDTPQGRRAGRITFSGISPDSVDWALAISSDGRQTWRTIWTMAMRRRAAKDY